ncbi:1-acyl-sn-glycerol-3-phosphate acyltransferase [Streptomyces sp. NBC_01775]|uniref:1-acyl-sn-glycerol-3-phosphate acyltransferase n=1 Tax=Streptomyces sp. NBC_01775 TaxID=2975939 RepID=UPI002DDC5818|nr:1-acyl-sn-glycerol-3-phosphate acyltransferase [Streptomyces sp. NBC_01775]WSB77519.1 1-acyl-sn-glycerol-3-phosphate acyltransferase [Streptomyces sp. NBC_01775]
MADAKVIPFDDDRDRSRGTGAAGGRSGRPRPSGQPGSGADGAQSRRRKGERSAQHSPLASVPGDPSEEGPAADVAQEGSPGTGAGQSDAPGPDAPGPGASRENASQDGAPQTGASGQATEGQRADGPEGAAEGLLDRMLGKDWEARASRGLSFLRRRITGDYEVDDFGYDQELTDQVLMSVLRPLHEKYFRVEVKGMENIPSEGAALVVSNHSGTLPLDGLMLQVAVHDHHPDGRHLRLLGADLVFMLPLVNELARKAGHTLACAEDAQALLERGEVVGVMPEGFKGLGKPFADRYKLQRFGRGGFVSTAMRAGAPIVPCSIVGAEEIYPMIGNSRTLARLFGFPYFPITPTFPWLGALGAVPLPTKWTIQFGEPIPTDGYPPEAAEDPMLMFNLTDQVRETIQHTLYKLLVRRQSVFF